MNTKPLLEQVQEYREEQQEQGSQEQDDQEIPMEMIAIPDISRIQKREFTSKRIIQICSCGNPYCRSPIIDPERWKWVDLEIDE